MFHCALLRVRWGAEVSRSFNVTNGVRQGSVLRPLLFSVYMDQLSYCLNQIAIGCSVGDDCLNHLIYADDICCFSPSICHAKLRIKLSGKR